MQGLQPDYVLVDEKDVPDWLAYVERLAALVPFHDANTLASSGTWQSFFASNVTATMAFVAIQDPGALQRIMDSLAILRDQDASRSLDERKEALAEMIDAVFTFVAGLKGISARLAKVQSPRVPLQSILEEWSRNRIPAIVRAVRAIATAARKAGLLPDPPKACEWHILGQKCSGQSYDDNPGTGADPDPIDAPMAALFALPEATPSGSTPESLTLTLTRIIRHAAAHEIFAAPFKACVMTYAQLLAEANANLITLLDGWRGHPPQHALLLAFLKLLRLPRQRLNQFTSRHLDFYYRDVLRLAPRKAGPDHAHVLIELARASDEVELPQGTLFSAGKDAQGNPIHYQIDKPTVFNKAVIGPLMAVYKAAAKDKPAGCLYAAPIINSGDGVGGELPDPVGAWHPFVIRAAPSIRENDVIRMPQARVGFAVASRLLWLSGGDRSITLTLTLSQTAHVPERFNLEVEFTGPKGWFKAAGSPCAVKESSGEAWTITIDLTPGHPPVVDHDRAVHGGSMVIQAPVMRLCLPHTEDAPFAYNSLRDVKVANLKVEVRVGMVNGKIGLVPASLAGPMGPIDPSKPFQPFGPMPAAGDSLVIGCPELLYKNWESVQLTFDWIPKAWVPTSPPKTTVEALNGDVCTKLGNQIDVFGKSLVEWNPAAPSRGGNLRISLDGDLGHREYLTKLSKFLAGKPSDIPTVDPGSEPTIPVLRSLRLGYMANATVLPKGEDPMLRWIHVGPFGEAEQDLSAETPVNLVPVVGGAADASPSGEFYMGISGTAPGHSVSLLFKVLEGSTDPKVAKPVGHVRYAYLSRNIWKPIAPGLVSDGTGNLTRSGIMVLPIPSDATDDNTLLPPGCLWLRMAVDSAPGAIGKLLAIHTQGAMVTRVEGPAGEGVGDIPVLPPETITRLKEPLPAIKSIRQPYPSFRLGRGGETEMDFRVRVSERLRHKDRAINVWDYERLVLQTFPQIYKAKCVNHATDKSEMAPGNVLVVTIPAVANRNDLNLLRPCTDAGLMEEIRAFLQARAGGHVTVWVANPLYEEIRLSFKLTLARGFADHAFYSAKLRAEIARFLSPWAFGSPEDIQFGGKIHKSVLIDFVEGRPYVDYVEDFKLHQKTPGNSERALEEAVASTASSVLVSTLPDEHEISAPASTSP